MASQNLYSFYVKLCNIYIYNNINIEVLLTLSKIQFSSKKEIIFLFKRLFKKLIKD